ncbi:pyroglutamyl-peptidase I [Paenibacillus sp. BC26]|uniref:pyroglutamyl-peptidase I n=1 Tax=Paenibacillus sp. BC26 TaxID=1881032 RepID=UPI0008E99E4C|nr:pyroglutamyl-peptidase I [Paenibacillus sp. BC26]SFS51460.1 pyroglutamyl-peptidase I Cysteine peptidase. MEROPS family C15 [Paenibacillus sp. BC26]
MNKILLTGFDPFGGETINPAWEVVSDVHRRKAFSELQVEARQIPTVFTTSIEVLRQAILEVQPEVVICVGQAGGRSDIALERVAINLNDARIPDNEGNQPMDEPIFEQGPAAYWSSLPIKTITAQLRKAGIPASVSHTAGTFVCNHLFYGLQHMIATEFPGIRGGFIHIPYLPIQTAQKPQLPSMSLETMVEAIEIAVIASVQHDRDIVASEGQLH